MTPHCDTVDGDPCFAHLTSVPDDVDDLVVMVHRDRAADVVRDAAERGITRVWLFKGLGGLAAVSDGSLRRVRVASRRRRRGCVPAHVLGTCELVYRVHRTERDMNASLQKAR